jgi:hypothetical protein
MADNKKETKNKKQQQKKQNNGKKTVNKNVEEKTQELTLDNLKEVVLEKKEAEVEINDKMISDEEINLMADAVSKDCVDEINRQFENIKEEEPIDKTEVEEISENAVDEPVEENNEKEDTGLKKIIRKINRSFGYLWNGQAIDY